MPIPDLYTPSCHHLQRIYLDLRQPPPSLYLLSLFQRSLLELLSRLIKCLIWFLNVHSALLFARASFAPETVSLPFDLNVSMLKNHELISRFSGTPYQILVRFSQQPHLPVFLWLLHFSPNKNLLSDAPVIAGFRASSHSRRWDLWLREQGMKET